MKLGVTTLGMTAAIIWGGAILIVSLTNLVWPNYGVAFLDVVSSVYPGYQAGTGFGSVIIGTLYPLVDAAIGGRLFACVYNLIPSRR